jgi:hypothetical protein
MPLALASYGPWGVVRLNDDGRREVVNRGMCWLAAEKLAGAMRDQSTEREIAEGWNYLPAKVGVVQDARGLTSAKGGRRQTQMAGLDTGLLPRGFGISIPREGLAQGRTPPGTTDKPRYQSDGRSQGPGPISRNTVSGQKSRDVLGSRTRFVGRAHPRDQQPPGRRTTLRFD